MALHNAMQVDPTNDVFLRQRPDGDVEIVFIDQTGDGSATIAMRPEMLEAIRTAEIRPM